MKAKFGTHSAQSSVLGCPAPGLNLRPRDSWRYGWINARTTLDGVAALPGRVRPDRLLYSAAAQQPHGSAPGLRTYSLDIILYYGQRMSVSIKALTGRSLRAEEVEQRPAPTRAWLTVVPQEDNHDSGLSENFSQSLR